MTEYEITLEFYQHKIYREKKVWSEVCHASYFCYKFSCYVEHFCRKGFGESLLLTLAFSTVVIMKIKHIHHLIECDTIFLLKSLIIESWGPPLASPGIFSGKDREVTERCIRLKLLV